jgi:hypothetical protein
MHVPRTASLRQLTLVEQYQNFDAIRINVDEHLRMSVRGDRAMVDVTILTSSGDDDCFHSEIRVMREQTRMAV